MAYASVQFTAKAEMTQHFLLCLRHLTCQLFSNHSAVEREQIIFTLETMKRRQEAGVGILFIDS